MSRVATALAALIALLASPVQAQDEASGGPARRLAFDTVTAYQDFFLEDSDWPMQVVFDAFAAVEVAPGWQISVRPLVWRIRGEWDTLLDQASIRYEVRHGINWRVEVGKFSGPIGLGLTENRPNINAGMLWYYRPYYAPVPSMGADLPRASLISAIYPYGAQVAVSGTHWDARAAVIDRAPVEFWRAEDGMRSANAVVGGGLTPRQGLRVGSAMAWGRYAAARPERPALSYRTVNVEAEFAHGYSSLSGEWVHSRFDAPGGDRVVHGWTAQAQRTVTPRLVLHSRMTRMHSPESPNSLLPVAVTRRYMSLDTTAGVLLAPELTLRISHAAIWAFRPAPTDHQLGVAVVWARRWW